MQCRVRLAIENHLAYAAAVADIDEDKIAQVAAAVHPAHEHNVFVGIGGAECAAGMRPFEIA
jgi:hypothetical protein